MESYLLKSSLVLALFYLFYRLVLSKGVRSQTKRFIGLSCFIISSCFFIIPNIPIGVNESYPAVFQKVVESSVGLQTSFGQSIPEEGMNILFALYFVGVVLFSLRYVIGMVHLAKLYFSSEKIKKWGFNFVIVNKPISPFTYFNLLFIGKSDMEKGEKTALIIHEQFHRDQFHSLDNLLLEIATIVYWFNPIAWLLKKDIKSQHEFMADEQVLSKGFSRLEYQHLLFEARTGVSFLSANYLSNQTSLKQRFIMMEKTKNTVKNNGFRIASFSLALATIMITSSFSPMLLEKLNIPSEPTFKIYTDDGEVDLEKGISKDTKRLYIRVTSPQKDDGYGYMVSKSEVTLVTEGLGRVTIRGGDSIIIQDVLNGSINLNDATLLLEIKEYKTRDKEKNVTTVEIDNPLNFKIPILE